MYKQKHGREKKDPIKTYFKKSCRDKTTYCLIPFTQNHNGGNFRSGCQRCREKEK